ncbi:hypothetical protein KHQ82_00980 [Mycoplasmatota bacterium]|nr:hypothetical protein KHQ82_00980 [Mycoplasmatota bacterium]
MESIKRVIIILNVISIEDVDIEINIEAWTCSDNVEYDDNTYEELEIWNEIYFNNN